jgi:hypothetical protein
MPANAQPRMARLSHASSVRKIISARIWEGPRSEIGKTVHIQVSRKDLPALRMLVEELEAEHE